MATTINYRRIHFILDDLTVSWVYPTFGNHHKLHNEVNSNVLSVYSNLRGRTQGLIGVVLTGAQYGLISQTPFLLPTQPVPSTIPVNTNVAITTIVHDTHPEDLPVFCEVVVIEQDLIQKIFSALEKAYIVDIWECTTNYINRPVSNLITHLQNTYGKLMTRKLLEEENGARKSHFIIVTPSPASLIW